MTGEVRVLVYHVTGNEEGIRAAYQATSQRLAGVPGLLGNELLRSVTDHQRFVVMSQWTSFAAFREWEAGPDHRDATAPLRPFQDRESGMPYAVYGVEDAY